MAHPWMTLFIVLIVVEAIESIGKAWASRNYWKRPNG
jgi:hypothetical protein